MLSFNPMLIGWMVALTIGYIIAAERSNRRYRRWPAHRAFCWIAGLGCVTLAIDGPLAELAHSSFVAHMGGHLLLGMLAPLLIALAYPFPLLVRSLTIPSARRLMRWMRHPYVHLATHPIAATIINIGSLWALYTTDLYGAMHGSKTIHVIVHIHFFLSGYVWTSSILDMNPVSHRYRYTYRIIVLILAIAGHSILAKWMYSSPPSGVPIEQAEAGAQLMYYGGDAVEAMLIAILCYRHYRSIVWMQKLKIT